MPASAPHPAAAVVSYYQLLGSHNFSAAWNLLGPDYTSRNSYNAWVQNQSTNQGIQVLSAATQSQSGSAATVAVVFRSTDTVNGPQTFQGPWTLVFANGSWKLNDPNVKQVG